MPEPAARVEAGADRPRGGIWALGELARPGSYRRLAGRVKYPVAALMISQTVLTFALTAVLTRVLGPLAFGEYAVILTAAGIFQLVAAFPVESGLPKFLAETGRQDLPRLRAYYSAGLWLRLAAGLAGFAACLPLAGWQGRVYGVPGAAGAIVLAAAGQCLFAPGAGYFLACIQGMERPRRWATANLLNAALVFPLATLGAAAFGRWGQVGLQGAIALGWLACVALSGVLARGALGFLAPGRGGRRQMPGLAWFLLPMWVVPLAGFGALTLVKTALALRWGAVAVGHLEVALSLLRHMGFVYHACMIVLLPEWSRLYADQQGAELRRSLAEARGVLVGIALGYGALLALGGGWLVPRLFGADQAGAVPTVRVIGLVMPVMIAGWMASATNIVCGRTGNIGKANVIWFSLVVPVSLVLLPRLGALGVALGWLGAYCVFSWYYVSRARPFFGEIEGW